MVPRSMSAISAKSCETASEPTEGSEPGTPFDMKLKQPAGTSAISLPPANDYHGLRETVTTMRSEMKMLSGEVHKQSAMLTKVLGLLTEALADGSVQTPLQPPAFEGASGAQHDFPRLALPRTFSNAARKASLNRTKSCGTILPPDLPTSPTTGATPAHNRAVFFAGDANERAMQKQRAAHLRSEALARFTLNRVTSMRKTRLQALAQSVSQIRRQSKTREMVDKSLAEFNALAASEDDEGSPKSMHTSPAGSPSLKNPLMPRFTPEVPCLPTEKDGVQTKEVHQPDIGVADADIRRGTEEPAPRTGGRSERGVFRSDSVAHGSKDDIVPPAAVLCSHAHDETSASPSQTELPTTRAVHNRNLIVDIPDLPSTTGMRETPAMAASEAPSGRPLTPSSTLAHVARTQLQDPRTPGNGIDDDISDPMLPRLRSATFVEPTEHSPKSGFGDFGGYKVARKRTLSQTQRHPRSGSISRNPRGANPNPLNPTENEQRERYLLMADDKYRVAVDAACLFAIAVEVIASSYLFAIESATPSIAYIVIICLFLPLHILFVLANFKTAMLKGWTLDESLPSIRKAYMRSWFMFDAAIAFPWDLVLSPVSSDAFRAFACARLVKLTVVPRLFRRSNPVQDPPVWKEIVVSVFWLLLIMHLSSCSRIFAATTVEQGFEEGEDLSAHRFDQYLSALYWSMATISSVGYGDLVCDHRITRILSLFWMVAGVILVIWSGAKLTQWLVVTDPFALAEIDKKRKLHALMSNNKIPWSVQKSALLVYPVILETSSRDYNNIIDELPQVLQDQIRLHVKLKLITKVPIFHGASYECLVAAAEVTVPEVYDLGSDIIEYGEIGAEMFFLEHGLVEVYTYNDLGQELWMANLKGGSFFGEISLLSNDCKRTATVRAVTQCTVYALAKESFDHVLELYPELIEKVDEHAKQRLQGLQAVSSLKRLRRVFRLAMCVYPRSGDSQPRRQWREGCRLALVSLTGDSKNSSTNEPPPDEEQRPLRPLRSSDKLQGPRGKSPASNPRPTQQRRNARRSPLQNLGMAEKEAVPVLGGVTSPRSQSTYLSENDAETLSTGATCALMSEKPFEGTIIETMCLANPGRGRRNDTSVGLLTVATSAGSSDEVAAESGASTGGAAE